MGLKTGLAFAVDTTTIEFKTDFRASYALVFAVYFCAIFAISYVIG
jgi:hypothetical protein